MPHPELEPDCGRCTGLCCVALPFSRSRAFAFDKAAGEACRHLEPAFTCGIHDRLTGSGMKGCVTYECFGAGQYVVQVLADPPVFETVVRLHEMLVLLDEAIALVPGDPAPGRLRDRVSASRTEAREIDIDRLAAVVGEELRRVSRVVRGESGPTYAGADLAGRDLRETPLAGADLRGALLIAADLRGVDLGRADLLGADLRDADLRGAHLSTALFLTRPQLNAARLA